MSGNQRTWPMQDGGGDREGFWDTPAECRDIEQDPHGKCGSASRERATTDASAVDYAIQRVMTAEGFEAELRHPPTPGECHGIDHLAKLGRKLRRGEPDEPAEPPATLPYRIEGDLTGTPPGYHLMLVRSDGDTATGALLRVPEGIMRRVLAADSKSRSSTDQG